ncbi:hypothetical protein BCh11DRAFT_06087 [Burkholderia sp. Ch1-1]|nr:hypothetical protein BCh11DRAFT_06087 [Burkholderia sp. Ch1-1]
MNKANAAKPTPFGEEVIDRLKAVERAIVNGLGAGQSAPAFGESIAMALGVASHGPGSFAHDVSRIADALERIADSISKA